MRRHPISQTNHILKFLKYKLVLKFTQHGVFHLTIGGVAATIKVALLGSELMDV